MALPHIKCSLPTFPPPANSNFGTNESNYQNISKEELDLAKDEVLKQFESPMSLRDNKKTYIIFNSQTAKKTTDLMNKLAPLYDPKINFDTNTLIDILGELNNIKKSKVNWLIISLCTPKIDDCAPKIYHCALNSKIQVNTQSDLQSMYSIYYPLTPTNVDSTIEIFGNSNAKFTLCAFKDSQKAAVIVRNYSQAEFDRCVFSNNIVSCLALDNAKVVFRNCIFYNDINISVFISKFSQTIIEHCIFVDLQGKGLYSKLDGIIKVTNSTFLNCQKGAVTATINSRLYMDSCIVNNSQNSAIRITNNSIIECQNTEINDTNGNAFNIDQSTGYIYKTTISNTSHPTVMIMGKKSTPYFYQCSLLKNKDTFAVISKACARPTFHKCTFDNVKNYAFSISDFSRPKIFECTFGNDITKEYFNLLGGSITEISNNRYECTDDKAIIRCSNTAKFNETIPNDDSIISYQPPTSPSIIQLSPYKKFELPEHLDCPSELLRDQNSKPKSENPLELNTLNELDTEKVFQNNPNNSVCTICCNCHNNLNNNENNDDHYILCPCGHCVCKDCSVKLAPKEQTFELCPVCNTAVKEIKKLFIEQECVVCLTNSSNTVALPCGHLCMCYSCLSKCIESNANCPLCNETLLAYKCMLDEKEFRTLTKQQVEESQTK